MGFTSTRLRMTLARALVARRAKRSFIISRTGMRPRMMRSWLERSKGTMPESSSMISDSTSASPPERPRRRVSTSSWLRILLMGGPLQDNPGSYEHCFYASSPAGRFITVRDSPGPLSCFQEIQRRVSFHDDRVHKKPPLDDAEPCWAMAGTSGHEKMARRITCIFRCFPCCDRLAMPACHVIQYEWSRHHR